MCTRAPGLGSLALVRGGKLHLVDLATCRDRVLVRRGAVAAEFVDRGRAIEYRPGWAVPARGGKPRRVPLVRGMASPDGRSLADVVVRGRSQTIVVRSGRTTRDILRVRESRGDNGLVPGPLGLVMWSPDSRWLFFAVDPFGSNSYAADGLRLRVIPAAGGRPHAIDEGLLGDDYRAWCGGELVMTAGTNRIATTNKRLDVASAPGWRARPLVHETGRAWGAMTCAPDGQSVVVQSQADSADAHLFHTHWSLWRVGLDGTRRRLTSPPPGYADESPRLSRDGRTVLFVRSRHGVGRLYALRARKLVGPLFGLGYSLGYYGHQSWWHSMDWSLGVTS